MWEVIRHVIVADETAQTATICELVLCICVAFCQEHTYSKMPVVCLKGLIQCVKDCATVLCASFLTAPVL